MANWRKPGRHGLSPTVGGTIASHWYANARLKLGSPQPIGCDPSQPVCSTGCVEIRPKLKSRLHTCTKNTKENTQSATHEVGNMERQDHVHRSF